MGENNKLNLTCPDVVRRIKSGEVELSSLDVKTLQQIMEYETDRLATDSESDTELLKRCADIISEREPVLLSQEDFMSVIRGVDKKLCQSGNPKRSIKRTATVAATVSLLIAACVLSAVTFGFSEKSFLKLFVKEPYGISADVDGEEYIVGGSTKTYASVEDAIKNEGVDVVFPSAFPKGVYVKKVVVENAKPDKKLFVVTNNDNIRLYVELGVNAVVDNADGLIKHNANGFSFYIFPVEKPQLHCASFFHNNNTYYLYADNYDDLIFILNSIKE